MSEYAQITAKLTEPVAAGRSQRADFRRDIYEHVPGSVLRGALAATWIRWHGIGITASPEFHEIFDGKGSFGPLHRSSTYPIPLSVRTHKYQPSLDTCEQLWWDQALGDDAKRCPKCGQGLVFSKGQARGRVKMISRTMTELSTDGVAKDGNLFSESALSDGLTLRGWLYGDALRSLDMPDGGRIEEVQLGSRRSLRGSADLHLDEEAQPDPVEIDGNAVILRLAAPGIFVDQFGMPSPAPDRAELTRALGVEVAEPQLWTPWARWVDAGGWHAASGMPKPTERAVAAGSTYRIPLNQKPSEQALRSLMARGIGLRRREGFGALYRATPPTAPRRLTGAVFPLAKHSQLIETLKGRIQQLRSGTDPVDNLENVLQKMDPVQHAAPARGLRTMLDIEDADIFEHLIKIVEPK